MARLEAVRLLLVLTYMSGFKLFQMDVKSAFLNGFINEEVYVSQPPDFEDNQHPNLVYKLKRLCMDSSEPLDSGMKGLAIFSYLIAMREEN